MVIISVRRMSGEEEIKERGMPKFFSLVNIWASSACRNIRNVYAMPVAGANMLASEGPQLTPRCFEYIPKEARYIKNGNSMTQ